MKLPNYLTGQWREGTGHGESLIDPVTGEELATISSQGSISKPLSRLHAPTAAR